MSNETVPSPSLSQGVMIENQFFLSSFAMLTYASLLDFPDEVTYIWRRKFTLPTCFYLLSKYPIFFYQIIYVIETFLSETSTRTCNYLGFVGGAISILPLIGVRGLVSMRTYSLCQGYLPLTITIFVTFLFPIVVTLYELTIPHCKPPSSDSSTLLIIRNAAGVPSDVLTFIVIYYHLWGLWRLARSTGLEHNSGFLTLILKQSIGGFCFLLLITPIQLVITLLTPGLFSSAFSAVPNTLSSLLICGSILDLRRRHEEYKEHRLDSDQSTLVSQRDLESVDQVEGKNSVDPVASGIATGEPIPTAEINTAEDCISNIPDKSLQSRQEVPSEGTECEDSTEEEGKNAVDPVASGIATDEPIPTIETNTSEDLNPNFPDESLQSIRGAISEGTEFEGSTEEEGKNSVNPVASGIATGGPIPTIETNIVEDRNTNFPDGSLQSIQDVPNEGTEGSTGVPGRNHTIPV